MSEREEFEIWFAREKAPKIDPSQIFLMREIMWEGWQGKAGNLDPDKK